jgi:hypothetical protein
MCGPPDQASRLLGGSTTCPTDATMNTQPTPPLPSAPGAHPDDDSVAGEEDPGAALDDLRKPTPAPGVQPSAPVPPKAG